MPDRYATFDNPIGDRLTFYVTIEDSGDDGYEPPAPEEPPAIGWVSPDEVVAETVGFINVEYQLEEPWIVPITVTMDLGDTPASNALTPGVDFAWTVGQPLVTTLAAGETSGFFQIQILDDAEIEDEESHPFILTAIEEVPQPGFNPGDEQVPPYGFAGELFNLRVTSDDVPAEIDWSDSVTEVREGLVNTSVKIVLSRGRATDTPVTVTQVAGPNVADRLSHPGSVLIPASQTTDPVSVDYDLTGLDNATVDGPEEVTLQLSSAASDVIAGPVADLAVTVVDPSVAVTPPSCGWDQAIYSTSEGQPDFPMEIVLDATHVVDITVEVTEGLGNAFRGTDWIVIDGPGGVDQGAGPWDVTITQGTLVGQLWIRCIDDPFPEGEETRMFDITAAVEATEQPNPDGGTFPVQNVPVTLATTDLRIAASDPVQATIEWEGPRVFSIREDDTTGTVRRVVIDGQTLPTEDFVVDITRSGPNVDGRITYPDQVTILASQGQTSADVLIQGLGDNGTVDGDEVIALEISTTYPGVTVPANTSTLDITVTDPPGAVPPPEIGYRFGDTGLSKPENAPDPIVNLGVRLYEPGTDVEWTGERPVPLSVTISIVGGTATQSLTGLEIDGDFAWANPPYDVTSKTLTMGVNTNAIAAAIRVFDNDEFGGDRTVISDVSAVEQVGQDDGLGGTYPPQDVPLRAGRETLTITILDDEFQEGVSFQNTANGQVVIEEGEVINGGGTGLVVVLARPVPNGQTVTVTVQEQPGGGVSNGRLAFQSAVTLTAGQSTAPLRLEAFELAGDQGVETTTLEIATVDNPNYFIRTDGSQLKQIRVVESSGVPDPIFRFEPQTQGVPVILGEPGTPYPVGETIRLRHVNLADVPQIQRTVVVTKRSGDATFGDDGTGPLEQDIGINVGNVGSPNVTFSPGQQFVDFRVIATGDGEIEGPEGLNLGVDYEGNAVEEFELPLEVARSFEVNADAGGSNVITQFEYPSGVFKLGRDTTTECYVSTNAAVEEDVTVRLRFWSHNAEPEVHWTIVGQTVSEGDTLLVPISAGGQRGSFTLQHLGAGVEDDTRWVFFEIVDVVTSASLRFPPEQPYGTVGNVDVYRYIMRGQADTQNPRPAEFPAEPGPVDYEVYAESLVWIDNDGLAGPPGQRYTYATENQQSGSNAFRAACRGAAEGGPSVRMGDVWVSRNPTGVDWGDAGAPIVIRVMEDCRFGVFINYERQLDFYTDQGILPVRDVFISGVDQGGGVRPKMFAFSVQNRAAATGQPAPPDHVHCTFLDFRARVVRPGQSTLSHDRAADIIGVSAGTTAWNSGILRFSDCRFADYDEAYTFGLVNGDPNGVVGRNQRLSQFCVRFNKKSVPWFVDCEMWPFTEQSCYVDCPQGLFVYANNRTPFGTGRSMVQVTQRCSDYGWQGAMSHGLAVISDNAGYNMGITEDESPTTLKQWGGDGARHLTVWGWGGDLVVRNYTVGGKIKGDSNVSNTWGMLLVAAENPWPAGTYFYEWPLDSGRYWVCHNLEISGFVSEVTDTNEGIQGTGTFMDVNGCYNVLVGKISWEGTWAGPIGKPFLEFNGTSLTTNPSLGEDNPARPVYDQIGRDVRRFINSRVYNRAGGVTWLGPTEGPTNGVLTSYDGSNDGGTGWSKSSQKARHFYIDNPTASIDFDNPGTNVESYDGSNP